MIEDLCKRCGKCCHYFWKGEKKRCKFLVDSADGKTECSIYETRLGTIIEGPDEFGQRIECSTKARTKEWIPGCPYNRPEWLRNKKQQK